jgi:hypothetical protein
MRAVCVAEGAVTVGAVAVGAAEGKGKDDDAEVVTPGVVAGDAPGAIKAAGACCLATG